MKFPQTNLSLLVKENSVRIMFVIYLELYFQGKNKTSIVSFKKKYDWYKGREFLTGELIQNATEKYINNLVAAK